MKDTSEIASFPVDERGDFIVKSKTSPETVRKTYKLVEVGSTCTLSEEEARQPPIEDLYAKLAKSPRASDLKWSLFCAACQHYRYNTLVKPFPKFFLDHTNNKDIQKLVLAVSTMPSFPDLLNAIRKKDVDMKQVELICWVLLEACPWKLEWVKKEDFSDILTMPGRQQAAIPKPNCIFEFNNSNTGAAKRFEKQAKIYGTKFAFHGSRVENYYSILNHGLQISMNKNGIFGCGIYLSTDLGVSLTFSPFGFAWTNSAFGCQLAIIALCEYVDHPDVKYKDSRNKKRSITPDGVVPDKYVLVQNGDLVRVRYLLIYTNSDPKRKSVISSKKPQKPQGGFVRWIKTHRSATFLIGYIILLSAIAIAYSPRIIKMLRS